MKPRSRPITRADSSERTQRSPAGAVAALDVAAAGRGQSSRRRVGDGLRPGRRGQPGAQAALSHRRVRLPIDTGRPDRRDSLDDQSACGSVTGGGRSARWDLRITPGDEQPVKLLTERGYKAKFPTAKTMVRHPLARFDGRLEIDDVRIEVDGWTGSVNHNWGRRHTPAYAFGQVCGFDEAPDSSLEIVTAHAAVGPISLPAATPVRVPPCGRELAVRSVLGGPPHTRSVPAVQLDIRCPCRRGDAGGRDHRRAGVT